MVGEGGEEVDSRRAQWTLTSSCRQWAETLGLLNADCSQWHLAAASANVLGRRDEAGAEQLPPPLPLAKVPVRVPVPLQTQSRSPALPLVFGSSAPQSPVPATRESRLDSKICMPMNEAEGLVTISVSKGPHVSHWPH